MPISAAELTALVEAFPWDEWGKKHLEPGYQQIYRDLVTKVGKESAKRLGSGWKNDDPFTSRFMTDYVGERIVQLQGTSKERVIDIVRETLAEAEGLTSTELGRVIRDAVEDEFQEYARWRANTVARTETAIAQNHGTVLGHKQGGDSHVTVFDGTDCPECAKVNNDIWTVDEALANPVEHPNAVFAGTRVLPIGLLRGGYRARWNGPANRFRTAGGADVTISPNHPVLTARGWQSAKALRQGDYVIRGRGADVHDASGAPTGVLRDDLDQRDPEAEQVFGALLAIAGHTRVVAAPTHFHGDGNFCEGEVDIVRADGLLTAEAQAALLQECSQPVLVEADAELLALSRLCPAHLALDRVHRATSSGMRRGDGGRMLPGRAESYAAFAQPMTDDSLADAELLGELQRGLASPVALDQIVEVADVPAFVGHAYDFETATRSYLADGVVVSNCVRAFGPYVG